MERKVIYLPTINVGFLAGDGPACWDGRPFDTQKECEEWIEEHKDEFTDEELAGCVYAHKYFA